jgi:hypothetical protein
MTAFLIIALAGVGILSWFVAREVRRVYLFVWLPGYLRQRVYNQQAKKAARTVGETHILFCMVDHFEPVTRGSTQEEERARMRVWLEGYPRLAARHHDSTGRPPQHTWFYPIEDYRAEYLEGLVELCQKGLGEIEVHLHHGHDTGESLERKLKQGLVDFSKHGAQLTQEMPSRTTYGFIHGNMALDNSRFDPEFCGVNDELSVLRQTGCYADFSLPTVPCVSQSRKVNAIYYATDDPLHPKSFDRGEDVEVGGRQAGDLLLVPGPLSFNWSSRKWGLLPRIENGEIQGTNPPTVERVRIWVDQHIHVKGRPEWVVVKVSCHGAQEWSWDALLGNPAEVMYAQLEAQYRDRSGYQLHYVTARELYNIIKAAEAGKSGDPTEYRNFVIPPYRTHSPRALNTR